MSDKKNTLSYNLTEAGINLFTTVIKESIDYNMQTCYKHIVGLSEYTESIDEKIDKLLRHFKIIEEDNIGKCFDCGDLYEK